MCSCKGTEGGGDAVFKKRIVTGAKHQRVGDVNSVVTINMYQTHVRRSTASKQPQLVCMAKRLVIFSMYRCVVNFYLMVHDIFF